MNDLGEGPRRPNAITHVSGPGAAPERRRPVDVDRDEEPTRPSELVRGPGVLDIVEEWGQGSFPASDPPANW